MKKVAIVKIGLRITYGKNAGTSGAAGEAKSLINMLAKAGLQCDCFTAICRGDDLNPAENISIYDTFDFRDNNYDALIVINGIVDFFGGFEWPHQILPFKIMNEFKGPIFYLYCDPFLVLRQVYQKIRTKSWHHNWNKSDVDINRPIHVISQSYNLSVVKQLFEKKNILIDSISQFDFQKFPMMQKFDSSASEKTVDLSYGGTFRYGKRENQLVEFYFGFPKDISVEIFGKITLDRFKKKLIEQFTEDQYPTFSASVDYTKMLKKMSQARFHIAVGDNTYPMYGMINQRIYEAINAGCIVLIDSSLDKDRVVFKDKVARDYFYVENKQDAIDKIRMMKKDYQYYLDFQRQQVNFDEHHFCSSLVELMQSKIGV